MKNLLLIIFTMASMSIFAQKAENYLWDESRVTPTSNHSTRYEIMKNDSLLLSLKISTQNNRKRVLWKNVAGMLTFGAISKTLYNDKIETDKPFSINASFIAGITGINAFSNSQQPVSVEAKHYDIKGTLLSSERLKISGKRKSKIYTYNKHFEHDGFVILTVKNIGKKSILASSTAQLFPRVILEKNGIKSVKKPIPSSPVTNSEAPPCIDCTEGGQFSDVVIIANRPNGEFNFHASYEANLGPTQTWQVSGMGSSGDASGDNGSAAADPGPEEKEIVRKLNNLKTNKCEAAYAITQLSLFQMGLLVYNKEFVTSYMNNSNMSAANTDGTAPENALKHALYIALNYCSIGKENAREMAKRHEVCNGVNQNPSTAELNMDSFNNDIGLIVAESVGCDDQGTLIASVRASYFNGSLHKLNGQPTP